MVASKENEQSGVVAFSMYINRLLGALSFNLQSKAGLYDDPFRATVFLLNNYHFISKRLEKDSSLLKLASQHEPELGPRFITLTSDNKTEFIAQWEGVVSHAVIDGVRVDPGGKVNAKEKGILKERFKSFNQSFDEMIAKCGKVTIPDETLAVELRELIADKIVQPYETFRKAFDKKEFTSKPNKYIKYSAGSIAEAIEALFDQAA